MFRMVKEFFRSLFSPAEYLDSDNAKGNDPVDNELIMANIDVSVKAALLALVTVSYTHLTLPTSDLV